MTQIYKISLLDAINNKFVECNLIDRVDNAFALQADESWASFIETHRDAIIKAGGSFDDFEHSHWAWSEKVAQTFHILSYPTMGIEYDGEIQGLMMLKTDGHFSEITGQNGLPIVYIPFLAAAPWNQGQLNSDPRLKGVGTAFLKAAIVTSIDLEFGGRIGLHALPQSESFYEKHGMTCLGIHEDKSGMKYYEMTVAQAADFLGD